MPDTNCLIGKRFGKLVVIGPGEPYITTTGHPVKRMLCRCDCGKEKPIRVVKMRIRAESCGCIPKHVVHGNARRGTKFPRTYRIWRAMTRRCSDEKMPFYARYGGRGIKVCDRWLVFENFLADMGECPSEKHSIERKEVNGDYAPGNCVWATDIEQANNKTNTVRYTLKGITGTFAELCRHFGVNYDRSFSRFNKGRDIEASILGKRPNAKLDFEKAHQIRELKKTMKTKDIAALFGISVALAEFVIANKKWVPPKLEAPTTN